MKELIIVLGVCLLIVFICFIYIMSMAEESKKENEEIYNGVDQGDVPSPLDDSDYMALM